MLKHPSCDERLRAFLKNCKKGLCIGTLTATGTYIIRSGSILYSISRTFFLHKIWSRTTPKIKEPVHDTTTINHDYPSTQSFPSSE
jgi:hypothetical protein